ncbi:MAG TPA: sulfatase-like hydrolase/transferase [Candidatus Polarisedimenticolaceae bacterium]|nr:sulfatase-like hydrolase/transferase [Candidatus Polarisedimenticolaceae bacterium]
MTRLAALALAITSCGCAAKPARTVILVTLDTTRADHLGCYGYREGHTPALDGFAGEAVLFEQAQAAVPVTLPSHATMFTGEYPPMHGVRYNGMFHVTEETVTLAERLKAAGFRTAAVPAAYPVARVTGLAQGFDVYRDLFSESDTELPSTAERRADDVTELGLAWLAEQEEEKAFLWLHYFDAHAPYVPPFPYSAQYRDHPYDGEIAYVDQALGKLIEGLKKGGRWKDAVILIAGDHGEGLYEHGEVAHADLVYQSTMHVPFLVKAPGVRQRRVSEPVSLVDVTPTILELAGRPVPPMAGRSLVGLLHGKGSPPRSLYFESIADSLLYGWNPLEGVRRGAWKYIRSGAPELYDVMADPGESVNRQANEAEVVRDLEAELQRLEGTWRGKSTSAAEPTPLDPRQMAMFASLGYLVGAVSTERGQGRNPRDGVHLMKTISQGQELFDAKQYARAIEVWKTVLEEDPRNRFLLLQSAYASVSLDDLEAATAYADRLVEAYPDFVPGTILLGELWVKRGDPLRAAKVFEAAASIHPDDRAIAYRRALAWMTAGDVRAARGILDRLVTEAPEVSVVWLARAAAKAGTGDPTGASSDFHEAVRRGYDDPEVLETEPLLAPLRKLPGYAALAAEVQAAAKREKGRT